MSALGGVAATWPLVARAQQAAMPVIGLLNISTPGANVLPTAAFRRGLEQSGYVEGRNIAIEYRWAEGQADRLPAMAADLIHRQVAVIFAGGPPAVRAAKLQSTTIPIVFFMGEDPSKEGLVASFNRPGSNLTGVTNFQNQLFGKQLGLLRELAPRAATFAILVNPTNPNAESDTKDAQAAAEVLGFKMLALTAKAESDFEPAFAAMVEQRVGGLIVGVSDLFFNRREMLFALASSKVMPAIYPRREYPTQGGLMSYGADAGDSWRQAGIYVGRILKGEKPTDLPVIQSVKFEFVINLKTAKALGLTFPPGLVAIADEVIE